MESDSALDHRNTHSTLAQDRIATWLLGEPFTLALTVWCLYLLATWIPHYLTWPWHSDHEHFAMVAQFWDAGQRPYRDVFTFQFPGEIYIFWMLGRISGWGNSITFYAFDSALVGAFGVVLALWSRRVFGRALPGLIGFTAFLHYYLGLDYRYAGQRDWHAAFFLMLGLLALDLVTGRAGRIVSALAFGLGLIFRPQALILAPAMVLAMDCAIRPAGGSWRLTLGGCLEWSGVVVLTVIVGFLPLATNGLLASFLGCLHSAGSSDYCRLHGLNFGTFVSNLPRLMGIWVAPALVFALIPLWDRTWMRRGWVIAAAVVGVSLIKAISPWNHLYYEIPQAAALAVALASLGGLILQSPSPPQTRLVQLGLLFLFAAPTVPRYALMSSESTDFRADYYGSVDAFGHFVSGRPLTKIPPGFHDRPLYSWEEIHDTVDHLREATTPTTPIANLLFDSQTAITSAVPRPSAMAIDNNILPFFPDKMRGVIWSLENTDPCIVVWNPREPLWIFASFNSLQRVIQSHFQMEARFGSIEVWKRRQAQTGSAAKLVSVSPLLDFPRTLFLCFGGYFATFAASLLGPKV